MAKKPNHQIREASSAKQETGLEVALPATNDLSVGARWVAGRIVGWAGVSGFAAFAPTALLYIGAMVLLLVLGVVLPAVWARDRDRRQAAAMVLRLLLTALCGARFTDVLLAAPPATADQQVPSATRE